MVTFRMLQQPFRQGTWHIVHTGMFVVHTGMFVMHTGVKIAQIASIASFELPPCLFFLVTACIA